MQMRSDNMRMSDLNALEDFHPTADVYYFELVAFYAVCMHN